MRLLRNDLRKYKKRLECVTWLSKLINNEIENHLGELHFSLCHNDIYISFADAFEHSVEICPSPHIDFENNKIIYIPYKTDIEHKLRNTIIDKICQLNEVKYSKKVENGAKVLVIDYARPFDSLDLHPFFINGYIQNILGKSEALDNNILKFNSVLLKDLSAIIITSHTSDTSYGPSCYINEKADFIINKNNATEIAAYKISRYDIIQAKVVS